MLQEMPNSPKTISDSEEKSVSELKPVETPPAKIVNSTKSNAETISTTESKENATKRKITEEKIKALFNKLEQVLPSPEPEVKKEVIPTKKDVTKILDKQIPVQRMEKIREPVQKENIEPMDSLLTSKQSEEQTQSDLFAEFDETDVIAKKKTAEIPLVENEELSPVENPSSDSRTVLDNLTVELSELEIQRSDFERKLGDIAFDRMRGLITEEEYKTRTQELRQNLERISKRIDQIMDRMRY